MNEKNQEIQNSANGASDELELTAKERETSAKDTPRRIILPAPNKQTLSKEEFHKILDFAQQTSELIDFSGLFHEILEISQLFAQQTKELFDYSGLFMQAMAQISTQNLIKEFSQAMAQEIKNLEQLQNETLEELPEQDIKQNLIYKPSTSKFVNDLQEIEPVKELTKYEVFKSKQKHVHIYFSFIDTSTIDEQLEHPLTHIEQLVLRACMSLFLQGVSTMTTNQIYSHMTGGIQDKSGKTKTRKASNGVKKDIEKALRHLKAIMIKLDCTEHFRLKGIDREQVDKDLLENGIHRSLLDTVEIIIQTANGKIEKGVQVVAPPPLLLYSEKLNELGTIEASENRLAFESVDENNVRASLQNIWIKDYLLQRENILEYKQEQVKKGKLKKSKLKNYRNIDMRRVYKLLGKENSSREVKRAINKNTRIMMNRYAMKFNLTNETK